MTESKKNQPEFAFEKANFKWLLIGIAFIVVGFILMSGGGSDNPNEFNPEVFSFRRVTLAPVLLMIGYMINIYAILYRPKK